MVLVSPWTTGCVRQYSVATCSWNRSVQMSKVGASSLINNTTDVFRPVFVPCVLTCPCSSLVSDPWASLVTPLRVKRTDLTCWRDFSATQSLSRITTYLDYRIIYSCFTAHDDVEISCRTHAATGTCALCTCAFFLGWRGVIYDVILIGPNFKTTILIFSFFL